VAVGVMVKENGKISFVGGPVDAVKDKAKAFIVVVLGDQSGKELFKRVLRVLAAKMPKELREKVLKASVEEIREFIPYNKGRVLEE
jgi:endonuclease III